LDNNELGLGATLPSIHSSPLLLGRFDIITSSERRSRVSVRGSGLLNLCARAALNELAIFESDVDGSIEPDMLAWLLRRGPEDFEL